jgi:DNA polymerase III alpha subunit
MSQFVHLHLHTDYSMLDGACDVEKLCQHVKKLGMPAVAMTDHGNIFGAVHFVNAAKAAGIKPIVGCELYVCKKDDHRIERTAPDGDTYNHLLVLAENEEGYRNLVKITSEASLHGFYYKPRVSKNFLAEHAKGLIALSGCLKGEVAENLMEEKYEAARNAAATYSDIFGKQNFFLEIQDQGLEMEHRIQSNLFRLEKELGLPLVATNDSHYLCEDDAHAQDVMVCIQTGKSIQDPNRMKFQGSEFYVKSHDEMYQVFKDAPDVLARSLKLNGEPYAIVGVMPQAFSLGSWFAASREIWVPLALSDADRAVRENHNQQALARLAPGATLAQGLSELEVISKRLEQEHPQENAGWGATLAPLRDVSGDSEESALPSSLRSATLRKSIRSGKS